MQKLSTDSTKRFTERGVNHGGKEENQLDRGALKNEQYDIWHRGDKEEEKGISTVKNNLHKGSKGPPALQTPNFLALEMMPQSLMAFAQ